MTGTGLVSLLLTWAADPVDQVANDRFETPVFSARHVAPVAYAAFAVVLGTVIGLLIRRTLPAMALTLLVFIAVRIAMPNLVRPYLMPPITTSKPMTSEAINELRNLGGLSDRPTIGGLTRSRRLGHRHQRTAHRRRPTTRRQQVQQMHRARRIRRLASGRRREVRRGGTVPRRPRPTRDGVLPT